MTAAAAPLATGACRPSSHHVGQPRNRRLLRRPVRRLLQLRLLRSSRAQPDNRRGGNVNQVPPEELRSAQLLWAAVDSPWVHNVDTTRCLASVRSTQALDPRIPSPALTSDLAPSLLVSAGSLGRGSMSAIAPGFADEPRRRWRARDDVGMALFVVRTGVIWSGHSRL